MSGCLSREVTEMANGHVKRRPMSPIMRESKSKLQ